MLLFGTSFLSFLSCNSSIAFIPFSVEAFPIPIILLVIFKLIYSIAFSLNFFLSNNFKMNFFKCFENVFNMLVFSSILNMPFQKHIIPVSSKTFVIATFPLSIILVITIFAFPRKIATTILIIKILPHILDIISPI
ncbi:unknown [Clostridium sp. CAG:921]|nr:unknown [Clostridium sp. CAG:921]